MKAHYLTPLFDPASVVVVGASEREGSFGAQVFCQLLAQPFQGRLHAVSSRHSIIQGQPAWSRVVDVPGDAIDLAITTTPARAPDQQDALDYPCPCKPQRVRLVRHVAPNGELRALMTDLFDEKRYPASCFGELYHQRWGIEEAFKRLKHRLNLEHVTGLSPQAA